MTTAENISLARRWYREVWSDRVEIRGPVEFERFAERIRSAFSDTEIMVDDIFGFDDKVAIRWHATMKHTGEMLGIPGTGKSVKITGTSIAQFRDGKVVAGWDNWDRLAMLEQIGAFTADATVLSPDLAKSA
jgi:predicted ester cyclase